VAVWGRIRKRIKRFKERAENNFRFLG